MGKTGAVHKKEGLRIPTPKTAGSQKNYIYLIRIDGDAKFPGQAVHKIGTTCNIMRRMKEHLRQYQSKRISLLWVSSLYSIHTALRVEHKFTTSLSESDWQYIPKDRFILPNGVKKIIVRVRKEWEISV